MQMNSWMDMEMQIHKSTYAYLIFSPPFSSWPPIFNLKCLKNNQDQVHYFKAPPVPAI